MSKWVVATTEGTVKQVIDVPDFLDAVQQASLIKAPDWVELGNAYVNESTVLPRQDLGLTTPAPITANGQDTAIIADIPSGTTVTCEGETHDVTDGQVEFSTDLPGTYTLLFRGVAYLDQEVVIEAVAE